MGILDTAMTKAFVMVQTTKDAMVDTVQETVGGAVPIFADWKIDNVLESVGGRLREIGSLLMVVIGIVMIIVGIFKIAQGLISHGKTQVNWVINILLIIVGALFCAGGTFFKETLTTDQGLGKSIADELEDLGK